MYCEHIYNNLRPICILSESPAGEMVEVITRCDTCFTYVGHRVLLVDLIEEGAKLLNEE
jgi:hypothetical protein